MALLSGDILPDQAQPSVRARHATRQAHDAVRGSRLMPPLAIWLPAALVALLMCLPLAYLLLRTLGAGEVALGLLRRPRTLQVIGNSALLALTVTALSAFLAVPLAWLQARTDLPLRRLWAVLTVLPLVIPSYVSAYTLVAALGPKGLLQGALAGPLGIQRLPEIYGFGGATLALTLCAYPYLLLSVRAALRGLDPACEEAARGLGSGAWRVFFGVTLPQLRPALGAGALLVALYVLSDFGAVALLQYDTFTRAIYVQYQASFDRTLAAALALVLVALTAVIMLAEAHTRGRARYARGGVGVARRARRVALGRWRWPALLLHALTVALGLGLPVGVLLSWLARGLAAGEALDVVWAPVAGSVLVALLAAVVTILAALPLAILTVRYPGPLASAIERLAYAGYALPGIVIALAFVFFGANYAPVLYQTLAMLVLAYLVRFLPQAVGAARTALLQISPHVEEAARGLGRSPHGVAWSVTAPLARSGLLAGGALVFLTTMKELPATLLLSPIGFETLATSIWSATNSALFSRAAVPALLLVLVSAVPVALMVRREVQE
jgi:iron(III) transport system permease protein